jgi:hypothetical protein
VKGRASHARSATHGEPSKMEPSAVRNAERSIAFNAAQVRTPDTLAMEWNCD